MTISNCTRANSLKEALEERGFLKFIEVHSPAAAIIAETSGDGERKFDGFWSSSLTDSATRGLPDTEILDPRHRIQVINEIFSKTTLPLIMDIDTGGRIEHIQELVSYVSRAGVSAICMEDKEGFKRNSLLLDASIHRSAGVEDFSNKIAAAKSAQVNENFMVIARLEGLILGQELEEIFYRARSYVASGADALLIHSKDSDPNLVMEIAREMKGLFPNIPLVAVPTTYSSVSEQELHEAGFSIVIYANQLFRSSVFAMRLVCEKILEFESSEEAELNCSPVQEIIDLHQLTSKKMKEGA